MFRVGKKRYRILFKNLKKAQPTGASAIVDQIAEDGKTVKIYAPLSQSEPLAPLDRSYKRGLKIGGHEPRSPRFKYPDRKSS